MSILALDMGRQKEPHKQEKARLGFRDSPPLTEEQQADLAVLETLPDAQIDTSDIPEVVNWSDAQRGRFYRPVKKQITLRVDADVLAWFKQTAPGGRGYQTEINRALRQHVQRSESA